MCSPPPVTTQEIWTCIFTPCSWLHLFPNLIFSKSPLFPWFYKPPQILSERRKDKTQQSQPHLFTEDNALFSIAVYCDIAATVTSYIASHQLKPIRMVDCHKNWHNGVLLCKVLLPNLLNLGGICDLFQQINWGRSNVMTVLRIKRTWAAPFFLSEYSPPIRWSKTALSYVIKHI